MNGHVVQYSDGFSIRCLCRGELSFTTDRIIGISVEVCSQCGSRPLRLTRPQAVQKTEKPLKQSDAELIDLLKAKGLEIGETPRQREWKSLGLPSWYKYRKRFGSIRIAVELAGLTYRPSIRV